MAITKYPMRNTGNDRQAEAFINGAGGVGKADKPKEPGKKENRKPTMIRIPPPMLPRLDECAARLGMSRSAFLISSAAEKMERMEA